MNNKKETGCCPIFNPKPWENKVFTWKKKKFVKGKVMTFFYMPLNFGKVITGLMKKIEDSKAKSPAWMGLSDHTSKWNMNIYVAVDKKIKDAENAEISGKFLSRVYEGPFKDTGKWCKDFEEYTAKKGYKIKKQYMWYTTCTKCAKVYGKNYVVIVGQLK